MARPFLSFLPRKGRVMSPTPPACPSAEDILKQHFPTGTIKTLPNDWILVAAPLLLDWMVFSVARDMPEDIVDIFCFTDEKSACDALQAWNDPTQDCPGKWHRDIQTYRCRTWHPDGTYIEIRKA